MKIIYGTTNKGKVESIKKIVKAHRLLVLIKKLSKMENLLKKIQK